jgi:hypothetical protein
MNEKSHKMCNTSTKSTNIGDLQPLYKPYLVDTKNKPFIEKMMLWAASKLSITLLRFQDWRISSK